MTNKELITKTLNFEPVPQVPFAVLSGDAWMSVENGLTPQQISELPDRGAKIKVDTYRKMGSQIMYGGNILGFYPITVMGGVVNNDILGAAEIIKRPLSEISDIENFDLGKLIADMLASDWLKAMQEQIVEMRKLVGDDEIICSGAYGAFTYASQFLGVDNFMMEILDDEDGYVEKTVRYAAEIIFAYNKAMVEAGADMICYAEPVASGDLISQAIFEEHVLPINKELVERTRALGVPVMMHICGNTVPRVASLADNTESSMFSVDSIDMEKAVEDAKGKMIMFGNLSPANIIMSMDEQGVYGEAKKLADKFKGKTGFVLAPGCDLAPGTPIENIQAMAKAAAETRI